MWVVGPFFLNNKKDFKLIKKIKRIKKYIIYYCFRIKRRVRSACKSFFNNYWYNKIVFALSSIIVLAGLLIFNSLTAERFPYELKFFQGRSDIQLVGSLSSGGGSFIEMGTGLLSFKQYEDIQFTVKEGDTLPEIAYLYNLEVIELMLYNNLDSLESLKPGMIISIPAPSNLVGLMHRLDKNRLNNLLGNSINGKIKNNQSNLPKEVKIDCKINSNGDSVTAAFYILNEIKGKGIYFEWDLGDGHKSFRREFNYTYNSPGSYVIRLTVKDIYGNEVRSNAKYIDIPHATKLRSSNQIFLTVNNVGDLFSIEGEVISIYDALGRIKDPIIFVNKSEGRSYYQAHASGFYCLNIQAKGGEKRVYLFISPFDSINNERSDVDWYRTQFATGHSNCGPALVSMAIGWSSGKYVSVNTIRDLIGWKGDGSTSFSDLQNLLNYFKIPNQLIALNDKNEIFKMLDAGSIVGIVYRSGQISYVKDNPQTNLIGRYYHDSTGHYSIIKGYTKDKKYFIVYDPIPSDWINNGLRYGDGISMIGRNRFYLVEEVFKAMHSSYVLEVKRSFN